MAGGYVLEVRRVGPFGAIGVGGWQGGACWRCVVSVPHPVRRPAGCVSREWVFVGGGPAKRDGAPGVVPAGVMGLA